MHGLCTLCELILSLQIGSLQMKIVGEDKAIEQKTMDLLQDWEKAKPVQVCVTLLSLVNPSGARELGTVNLSYCSEFSLLVFILR